MRVLVTNARLQQAYAIVAGLRAHVEWIVATAHGRTRRGALLAPACRSRLTDARYAVPAPPKGWLAPDPTEAEEQYVRAVLEVCRREAVNLVIPSHDVEVYILSRQKDRFAERGVTVAVSDFAVQAKCMDKVWMLREAERAGIPVSRTFVPGTRREAEEALAEVGLPAVVKPAYDAGGEGLRWILRRDDLDRYWRPPTPGEPDLLIQEYLPGPLSTNLMSAFTVLDRDGEVKGMFTHRRLRYGRWYIGPPHAASVSTTDPVLRRQTVDLLRALGCWGAACVEWKRDARDGRIKLLEPNPRIGATVWVALAAGVNLPWILAQVALGQDPPPAIDTRGGRYYIDPIGEVLALATYLAHGAAQLVGRRRSAGTNGRVDVVPPLGAWLRWVARTYLSGRCVTSDFWRDLRRDPLPGLLYWAEQVVYVARHHRDFLPRG